MSREHDPIAPPVNPKLVEGRREPERPWAIVTPPVDIHHGEGAEDPPLTREDRVAELKASAFMCGAIAGVAGAWLAHELITGNAILSVVCTLLIVLAIVAMIGLGLKDE